MKQTLNAMQQLAQAFQALPPIVSALSADLQAVRARRRKMKRFHKMEKAMQKQADKQAFGMTTSSAIDTGNHPNLKLMARQIS